MKIKIIALLLCIALLSGYFGCASVSEQHKGAATGAAVGAAAGAVAGAVIAKDHRVQGAVLGGLLGALLGGVIGHYAYDKTRDREETAKRYEYQESSGILVRVEEVSAVPASIAPGGEVKLGVTYALLDADQNASISITEIREITLKGDLVGKPEVTVSHVGGTYSSTVPLYLPANAAKGVYKVVTTIKTANAQDSKETSFEVK